MAPGSARGDDTPESEKSGTREYWIWEYRVPEYRNMQNPGKKKKKPSSSSSAAEKRAERKDELSICFK